MDRATLQRARQLDSEIYTLEQDINDLQKIISEFSTFGSTITFKRNSDGYTRSFGSMKFGFKQELKTITHKLLEESCEKLKELRKELKEL